MIGVGGVGQASNPDYSFTEIVNREMPSTLVYLATQLRRRRHGIQLLDNFEQARKGHHKRMSFLVRNIVFFVQLLYTGCPPKEITIGPQLISSIGRCFSLLVP
jgi:hypothetical protein